MEDMDNCLLVTHICKMKWHLVHIVMHQKILVILGQIWISSLLSVNSSINLFLYYLNSLYTLTAHKVNLPVVVGILYKIST